MDPEIFQEQHPSAFKQRFSEVTLQNFVWLGIFWRGAYWVGFNLGEKKIVRCLMLVAFPKSQCVFRP